VHFLLGGWTILYFLAQDQLEELLRERERLLAQFREQRDRTERERVDEQETHRRELAELRRALESLQKEIGDRQVCAAGRQMQGCLSLLC